MCADSPIHTELMPALYFHYKEPLNNWHRQFNTAFQLKSLGSKTIESKETTKVYISKSIKAA